MKKIGKFMWAFLAMLAMVVVSGVTTLGSVRSTGDSMICFAGKTAVYQFVDGQTTLESVYLNVGAIYEEVGANCKIEVEYTDSSAPSESGIDLVSPYYISNISSEVGTDGVNYNWHAVATGKATSARFLFVKSDSNIELREILAFNTKGEKIELEPYAKLKDFSVEERQKAIDAQDEFSREQVQSTAIRYNFTQDEAIVLSAIDSLTAQNYAGFVHLADNGFGILSTAIMSVPVALFGASTFSLRLMPFLAGVTAIVIAFFFAKELFKSEKYAFFTVLLFVLCGVVTSLMKVGSAYALVAAAILASAYFMYQFFAKGISNNRPLRSGMNVCLSGVFATLAVMMETLSAVPVAAILVLFGFGVARVFASEKIALEKAEGTEEEKAETVKKVKENYSYKKRVAIGFAFLTFVVIPFLTVLGVGVGFYKPLVLIYDNVGEHTKSVLALVFSNVLDAARVDGALTQTAVNAKSVFAWLFPIGGTEVYSAMAGEKAISFGVAMNVGVTCLSVAALLFCTYKVAQGFVEKTQDKSALRLRRLYFIFLSTMAATMIAAGAKGMPTALSAGVFSMALVAYLPLTASIVEGMECQKAKTAADIILYASVAVAVIVFAINLTFAYGIAV